jgi:aryl-alcohol dehydrogenase-like predicted oxidoreductase
LGERNDVVVATKVGLPFKSESGSTDAGLSRKRIMVQAAGSLSRLKRDRIDLYQIHRWDYSTPISETLKALTELIRQGTVGYIGASAMFAWQFMHSLSVSEKEGMERFVSMQNRYNLVYREEEREMIPLCRQFGIVVLPYSPLARGFLSGKYQRDIKPDSARYRSDDGFKGSYLFENDFDILDVVKELAKEKGVKPTQVALAWLLSKPWVTSVILGATKIEQIDDAVDALSVTVSTDEVRKLEERYLPHQLIGPLRQTIGVMIEVIRLRDRPREAMR